MMHMTLQPQILWVSGGFSPSHLEGINTDHTSADLKQQPECVFCLKAPVFERERDCSVFRQAVQYLTEYPLQKGFFPYKGGQCFSWESWPQYKVDEVTFIFKATETAL